MARGPEGPTHSPSRHCGVDEDVAALSMRPLWLQGHMCYGTGNKGVMDSIAAFLYCQCQQDSSGHLPRCVCHPQDQCSMFQYYILSSCNEQPDAKHNLSSPMVVCATCQNRVGLGWMEIDSENHRVSWVRRDPSGSSGPPPSPAQNDPKNHTMCLIMLSKSFLNFVNLGAVTTSLQSLF